MLSLPTLTNNKYIRYILIGGVLLILGWVAWFFLKPPPAPTGVYTQAPEAYSHVEYLDKKINVPLKIHNKKKAVAEMKLPPSIAEDSRVEVLATTEVQPNEGKTKVVSTIDTTTGKTSLYLKPEPPEFLRFENKGNLSGKYGYSLRDGRVGELEVYWKVLGVGWAELGPYGKIRHSFDFQRTDAEVGLKVDAHLW